MTIPWNLIKKIIIIWSPIFSCIPKWTKNYILLKWKTNLQDDQMHSRAVS